MPSFSHMPVSITIGESSYFHKFSFSRALSNKHILSAVCFLQDAERVCTYIGSCSVVYNNSPMKLLRRKRILDTAALLPEESTTCAKSSSSGAYVTGA